MDQMIEKMRNIPDDDKYTVDNLSEREKEILICLCNGMCNKEIAKQANISTRTVKNHLYNIYTKLNVSDRTQAMIYAIKSKLIYV